MSPHDLVYTPLGAALVDHVDGDRVWLREHGCLPRSVPVDALCTPPDRTDEPDWLTMDIVLHEPVRCGVCGEPEDAWGCSEGECRAMVDERQGGLFNA